MKKFRYVGECEKGCVSVFGLEFLVGEPVKVDDPRVIEKLSNNSHFKEVKTRGRKNGNEGRDSGQSSEQAGDQSNRSGA